MRTTIDIDGPILDAVKRLQRSQGKSLGRVVSELLAQALATKREDGPPQPFKWIARPMQARVDLADQEALNTAMDESDA